MTAKASCATDSRPDAVAEGPAQTSKAIGDFLPDLPRPAVMATVVRVTGSAPQEAGARMWIAPAEVRGTVGGGELERRVMADALGLLARGESKPSLKEYVLCRQLGQCCGGRVEVFLEPIPRRRTVHLFGGGHVGRALAATLAGMPFELHVVDPRPEWSTARGLAADTRVHRAAPADYVRARRWGAEDAACIFTHSHDLDFETASLLLREPLGYLGLIGSEHKARVFRARMEKTAEQGAGAGHGEPLTELWDRKMRCPIGLPLPSKNPKVIAVAIAAQLLEAWGLQSNSV